MSPRASTLRPRRGYLVPVSSGALARAVFVLLVLATVAAFFVTQRLKSGQPVVKRLALQRYFSPNGDGRKDRARISFFLPKGDLVTVDVVDAEGDRVRRLVDGRSLRRGRHVYSWNGRADDGTVPPDGTYYVRVTLRRQGRAATGVRGIELVTRPPHPRLISVTPSWLPAGSAGSVTIRYTGPSAVPPVYGIWRIGPGPARRLATLVGDRQTHSIRWDAQVGGRPAPPGEYALSVTVQNRALIAGAAPSRLPPVAGESAPRTGLTIGGPTLAPPLEPVRAGAITTVAVYGGAARVHWRLARIGSTRPVADGHAGTVVPAASSAAAAAGAGPQRAFALRVPDRARTGVYVLTVAAGGRAVRTPLVVRGRGSGAVLVVVPTLGWQGSNTVDDDGNGFPDTLYAARSVPLARPFAGGALPPGLTAQVGPLLQFLDRSGIHYDLTTDLELALGRGARLAGHPGVALAGDEPWLTPALAAELAAYVEAGGHVASFGGDSLRRRVSLSATALSAPTAPSPRNALGESTALARGPQASLAASVDDLGLFAGTGGVVGPFTSFDDSVRLPPGTRALTAAGARSRSDLVAYRLGRGLVIRLGTPQWASALGTSSAVQEVTKRTWALLSR
jgi:N,N-dimethylformamidase beta subunit-like protein/flagellar hook capping protein FlgD